MMNQKNSSSQVKNIVCIKTSIYCLQMKTVKTTTKAAATSSTCLGSIIFQSPLVSTVICYFSITDVETNEYLTFFCVFLCLFSLFFLFLVLFGFVLSFVFEPQLVVSLHFFVFVCAFTHHNIQGHKTNHHQGAE